MSESRIRAGSVLLFILMALVVAAGAQESGSVTRGRTFTVTVVGDLRTPYVVWVSGTSGMSGEPGDQPPAVAPGQTDVTTDPPVGPYLIGSTPTGGGRTVLDDVAPTSSVLPNTSYYAQVRTGIDGRGVVLFLTSRATATGQFHVAAVNPVNPDREVTVILGVPAPLPSLTVIRTPTATPGARPVVPVSSGQILVIPETTTEAPVPPTPTGSPAPPEDVAPAPPSPPGIPVGTPTCGIALGVAFLAVARLQGRKG